MERHIIKSKSLVEQKILNKNIYCKVNVDEFSKLNLLFLMKRTEKKYVFDKKRKLHHILINHKFLK